MHNSTIVLISNPANHGASVSFIGGLGLTLSVELTAH